MNRFAVLNLLVAIGLVASVTAIDCNNRPDFRSSKHCCPHDDFISSETMESCKDLKKDDANSMEGGPGGGPPGGGPRGGRGHGPPGHKNSCYDECLLNATGMVNLETMAVDEAKTKSYLTKSLSGNPDFVQVVSDAIVKCAEKGKEMHAMRANDPRPSPPPGSCKPCASMLRHCVKMETTINCPTSAWKNDETCNNIREFMMVCKPPHPGPPK